MSFRAILVRFPDESVNLGEVEGRRVLTALEVMYEGGSLHGKTADFPSRDLERVCFASMGVIGIPLKPMSAQSASIFAAGERSFATLASVLNPTTAVGGRGCSATTGLQRERAKMQMNIACSSRRFASAN
jgi:hypothetical protein